MPKVLSNEPNRLSLCFAKSYLMERIDIEYMYGFQENIRKNILTSDINLWENQIEWALALRYKTIYSCGYLERLNFFCSKWAFSKPNQLYKKFFYVIAFILKKDLVLPVLQNILWQDDLNHTLIEWSIANPSK